MGNARPPPLRDHGSEWSTSADPSVARRSASSKVHEVSSDARASRRSPRQTRVAIHAAATMTARREKAAAAAKKGPAGSAASPEEARRSAGGGDGRIARKRRVETSCVSERKRMRKVAQNRLSARSSRQPRTSVATSSSDAATAQQISSRGRCRQPAPPSWSTSSEGAPPAASASSSASPTSAASHPESTHDVHAAAEKSNAGGAAGAGGGAAAAPPSAAPGSHARHAWPG